MKLGITLLEDRLLVSFHYGAAKEPEFRTFPLIDKTDAAGWVWRAAGEEAYESFRRAEKAILALPASATFLKRLEVDGKLAKEQPTYLPWLASTQLPGDLSQFRYDFVPLRESFDSNSVEMLFYAIPAELVERLLFGLKTEDQPSPIGIFPEQLGLVRVAEKSIHKDDIAQAGIVNCDLKGAGAVYIQDGRFNHCRYFPANKEELATDIETYFLSRADVTESLPLIITGIPEDFKTNWSPVVPAFLGIHNLEYAAGWGVADLDGAG
ncbi:MAG TPA: hypothetical protein DCZ43_04250 [candidate division Zixibacteria bacterium]|nr:hypothetical protein [candidate division Zixibacteria bacterium]